MARILENLNELCIDRGDIYLIFVNKDLKVNYDLRQDATIIYIFNNEIDINFKDEGKINQGASVKIAYLDLTKQNIIFDSNVDVYANSELQITLKALGIKTKKYHMNYQNRDINSKIKIDNSVVCLSGSDLNLTCIGKIFKGAKASCNHQSSRCLNIDRNVKSKVEPVLLIDENDVLASHALSSGAIDEDILFYLNSRGIDMKEASVLFIHSYLLLDEAYFMPFDNKEDILAKIESQVDEIYA